MLDLSSSPVVLLQQTVERRGRECRNRMRAMSSPHRAGSHAVKKPRGARFFNDFGMVFRFTADPRAGAL